MMERIITAIKVQRRNPQRVSIDLDGEYAFGLSRLVGAWLKTGDRLNDEKIKALLEQDTLEVAYQRALNLLNHRPRTEKEIRNRLAEKDFTTVQIDLVLERLKRANLIQDADFAKTWVENRIEFHPRSKRLMQYELKNKGIADVYIDDALENSATDTELAYRAAIQYAHRLTRDDWDTFRRRLSGYLARRGFSYGLVAPIVSSLWQQQNSSTGNSNKSNEEAEK
jgi:regulatory protein